MLSAPKRVAVIAVHGISDQKPHHTAREVADIINMLPTQPEQELYASSPNASEEHILRIPVRMAKPWEASEHENEIPQEEPNKGWLWKLIPKPLRPMLRAFRATFRTFILDPIASMMSSGRSLVKVRSRQEENRFGQMNEDDLLAELESDFLNDQLANYAPNPRQQQVCDHYRTIRIDQSVPNSLPSTEPADITTHVYEMYWGDLSRLGDSAIALFNEFFQLLFHLASLGQHVVTSGYEEASAHYAPQSWGLRLWRWYMHCQELAVALISLVIPLLSLHLLVLMGVTLIGKLPIPQNEWLFGSLLTTLVLPIAAAVFFGFRKLKFDRKTWVVVSLLAAVVSISALQLFNLVAAGAIGKQLAIAWLVYALITVIIQFGPVAAYEKRRPGASLAHMIIGLATTLTFLDLAPRLPLLELPAASLSYAAVVHTSFRTIERLYLALAGIWTVFYLTQVQCWFLGQSVKSQVSRQLSRNSNVSNRTLSNWKIRIKRCNTTARMTLAAAAALYFIITTGLWSGLNQLEKWLHVLPQGGKDGWYSISDLWFQRIYQLPQGPLSSQGFIQALLSNSVPLIFWINLLLLLLTIATVIGALWPSVSREGAMPQNDERSPQLGRWLDRGFKAMLWVSALGLTFNMVVLMPLGYVVGILSKSGFMSQLNMPIAESFWVPLAAIPILFVVVLLSEKFRSQLRGVLDAILDVDNYLRIHPVTDNPRSRIFARYISLLRHLGTQNYDGIVIVAHSQGAVISADVLRFLQREAAHVLKAESANTNPPTQLRGLQCDPIVLDLVGGDRPIPVSLFTMGAPIHQLYSHAFPHLYHWAAHYDKKPSNHRASDRPNPAELGLHQWVNAYGSGDYVGRHLWGRSDQMFKAGENLPSGHDQCYEFCLSDGAHTHYWDGTRSRLAQTIQELVSAIVQAESQPASTDRHIPVLVTPTA
jgi:hypothetical protein